MLVASQVVQHHDLPAVQGRKKNPLDVDDERFGVHGALQGERSRHPAESYRGNHCGGLPMSGRRLGQQTLPLRATAVQTHPVRLGPAFIDESEALRVEALRVGSPWIAGLLHVVSVLLCGAECLFLYGSFIRSNARCTVA